MGNLRSAIVISATVLLISALFAWMFLHGRWSHPPRMVPIGAVAAKIQTGQVDRVIINGARLEIVLKGGQRVYTTISPETIFAEQMRQLGVSEDALEQIRIESISMPGWKQSAAIIAGLWILYLIALGITLAHRPRK